MPTAYPSPFVPVNRGSKSSGEVQNPYFAPPAPEFRQVPSSPFPDSPWMEGLPRDDMDSQAFTPGYTPDPQPPVVAPPTPEFRAVPGFDDHQFAAQAMDDFDSIQASLDGVTPPAQQQPDPEPYVNVNPAYQTPIGERPRDRSWMFEQRPGWDTATTGSRNYKPAPVTFNNTNSSNWGTTALDKRPGNNGPAASTVRFYQRALDRAQAGSRSDVRRVNRLPLRINTRPTNQDNG